ncbi:MAG: hypothetical protein K8J08_10025 [Thermoanaerobaculia bacterium]|nr:hypothetical protein [Thermoanaerobaculia bacterium]
MRQESRTTADESAYRSTVRLRSAPRLGLAGLGLVLLLSGQSLACHEDDSARSAIPTVAQNATPEVLTTPPPTGTACDLETDAQRTAEIVALFESDGLPPESEHTLADWQTLAADYQKAWAAAKSEASFIEYWHGIGGNTDPYGFSDLFRRTTRGDAVALQELQEKYPGTSYLGMAFSAASSAIAEGNSEVAEKIVASIDRGLLDDGKRLELAASFLSLGKTSEASSILEATPKGDQTISPHAGGIILLHFIEELGIEEGVARYERLTTTPPSWAIYGAASILDEAGKTKDLEQLLASEPTRKALTGAPAGLEYFLAELIGLIEKTLGEAESLEALNLVLASFEQQTDKLTPFNLETLVNLLARNGCSDACLTAAREPIRRRAQGNLEDWNESWIKAQAATGDLESAMAVADDIPSLFHPATEYASGRQEPGYVAPLLTSPEVENQLPMLVDGLLYASPSLEVVREAMSLAPAISDPTPWNRTASLVVYATYLDEATRLEVRKQLVRASMGGCPDFRKPVEMPPEHRPAESQ